MFSTGKSTLLIIVSSDMPLSATKLPLSEAWVCKLKKLPLDTKTSVKIFNFTMTWQGIFTFNLTMTWQGIFTTARDLLYFQLQWKMFKQKKNVWKMTDISYIIQQSCTSSLSLPVISIEYHVDCLPAATSAADI